MECKNMLSKRIKCVLIILLIMLTTINVPVFAVEDADVTDPAPIASSAYIEMKVKTVKVGETNQVLVECWASNLTMLESMDIAFSYDSTKLEPSNISSNDILENLASIKTWPTPINPSTGLSNEEEEAFNNRSFEILSNSFAFEENYQTKLALDIFRYVNTEKETLQFVMSKKDDTATIDISGEELIGTFSFVQKEGATIEEGVFNPEKNIVICNNGSDDVVIVDNTLEFTYQKYGSISGKIETGYMNGDKFEQIGKNIATVKLYNVSDIAEFDWTEVGSTYKTNRLKLQPIITGDYEVYYRPDNSKIPEIKPVLEITIAEEDLGKFKLDKVLFGEYIVIIDKVNYADYIIQNIVIDGTNKDIDLGNIQLEAGDLNKDGIIDKTDRTIFLKLYTNADIIKDDLGIVAFDLNDDGNEIKSSEKTDRTYMLKILANSLNKTIKKVESLAE